MIEVSVRRSLHVQVSAAELTLFIDKLRERSKELFSEAMQHPLRSQDPDTVRYDILEDSANFAQRADELEELLKVDK